MIILSVLISLLLVPALLLTLLVALSTTFFTGRVPSGPDAMGLAGPMLAGALSWALMLVAAWLTCARGGFAWLAPHPVLAAAIVSMLIIGLALAAGGGFLAWSEQKGPWAAPAGNTATLLSPLVLQVMLLVLAWRAPESAATARWPLVALALLAPIAATGIGLGVWGMSLVVKRNAAAAAARMEEIRAERAHWARRASMTLPEQVAEDLAALPPECPLWSITTMLNHESDPECRRLIVERALAVPNFDHEVQRTLASPFVSIRAGVIAFLREVDERPTAWGEALEGAMLALAQNIRVIEGLHRDGEYADLDDVVQRTVEAAQELFPERDFKEGLPALRAAVEGTPEGERRDRAMAALIGADRR